MAREFSFKEARELVAFYKKLLKSLTSATNYPSSKLRDVRTQFNSLKLSGYFANLANHEIEGIEFLDKKDYFERLLLLIDNYIKGIDLASICDGLYKDNQMEINSRIDRLSPAANPIAWVFTSKKKKDEAIEQLHYLQEYKTSIFVENAFKTLTDLNDLDKTNIDDVKYSYFNQRESFFEVVSKADSSAFKDNAYIERVRNLITKNNNLVNEVSSLREAVKSAKAEIKKAVDYLVAQELINLLRAIPIDEVNRDKKGIRVKSLRDAGYTNMADVYAASVYNLSSVYGISQDVAYTVKRVANDYAKKAQQGIKIKLSVDNKNKLATNVVRAVYALRQINKFLNIIDEQNKVHSSKIRQSFDLLKTVGNGSIWPFVSQERKDSFINAYSYLKETLLGEYGQTISKAMQDYRLNKVGGTEEAWADFAQNSIQFYNIIEDICPGVLGTDDSVYGLPEDLAREIQDECIFPDGLLCTLRRYQEWGVKYILHQEKVLLGDEMGLGKTVQAIATMVSLKNTGATHFVVVCPASVLTNWCREITKHSRLRVIKIHGYGKIYAFRAWLRNGGVAVTTYESTGAFKFDNPSFKFSQLVVDEAHYVKNPNATRSKRVRALCEHAERILFMTGTALENRVDEMIELISVLRLDIANKISRIAFMSTAPQFRQEIAPVYYRRKREDVLTELPDLIENEEWCTLTPEEENIYETAVLGKSYMEARRVSWNIEDLHRSSKARRLLEIIEDAKNDNRKILVFSFFLDTIRKIHDLLGDEVCLNPINGSINPNRRQEIIDEFDAAPAGTVLCAQIQSGGTGLNIQAASVVVICEPQLKPSIENQAISRAYRMGQSRNVQVFRLLCEDTIDERMMDLLKEKQAIFDAFADKSVAAEKSVEIDDKSFGDLINAEIERIKAKNGGATPRPYEPTDTTDEEDEEESDSPRERTTYAAPKKEKVNLEPIQSVSYNSSITYEDELKMSYKDLVAHLLSKYGPAKGDYFLTESCRSKNNAISRGKEGLFCHHIDEDKAILLSNPDFASKNPFDYQKADRLVYCDILEHLILHIKIAEEPKNKDANENELVGIGGAATFICRQINDCYSGKYLTQYFMLKIREQIKDKFNDYIKILQRLYDLIKNNPTYSIMFSKDDICSGYDGEIVRRVYDAII